MSVRKSPINQNKFGNSLVSCLSSQNVRMQRLDPSAPAWIKRIKENVEYKSNVEITKSLMKSMDDKQKESLPTSSFCDN